MKKIKISIITVCLNSEKTIENTIKSVLSQSYNNIEYIIVDGNSTDSTCKIIYQYKKYISYFISEPDNGIYSAWNKGVKASTGDYIFILNSDDTLIDNNVVEDVVEQIQLNNFPIAIHAKVRGYEIETGYTYIDGKPTQLKDFIYRMNFCTPAAFISKIAYEEIGLYPDKYRISGDYDWTIRLFKKYEPSNIIYYNRITTNFSVGGCSNKYYKLAYNEVADIIKNHFSIVDYIKHVTYIKFRMVLRNLIPLCRQIGILNIWRKIKKVNKLKINNTNL